MYREANRDKTIDFDGEVCRMCGVELDDENCMASGRRNHQYICKVCKKEKDRLYQEDNIDKIKAQTLSYRELHRDEARTRSILHNRKNGAFSMRENKECTVHYGVYINEKLLKLYFNDVEVMPYGHPGYDFICNNGWKIDGKSSFTGDKGYWQFTIKCNTTADYFFCVAYDNREDLNIIHIWMLPADKFSHLTGTSIRPSTLSKWAEYEQPIDKVISCCDSMRDNQEYEQ